MVWVVLFVCLFVGPKQMVTFPKSVHMCASHCCTLYTIPLNYSICPSRCSLHNLQEYAALSCYCLCINRVECTHLSIKMSTTALPRQRKNTPSNTLHHCNSALLVTLHQQRQGSIKIICCIVRTALCLFCFLFVAAMEEIQSQQ